MITLVFLHGLLGNKSDWEKIVKILFPIPCVCIDLPFHGEASNIIVEDFEDTTTYLTQQIQNKIGKHTPYIIVGYSLGGRLALYYALQSKTIKNQLKGLILEGANFGLVDLQEKEQRWQNDLLWAKRFTNEKIEIVLNDWYQQPVFSHLNHQQRKNLIERKRTICGYNISQMLKATSLAKQPNFIEKIHSTSLPIYYIVGERDAKFKKLAQSNNINTYIVKNVGHNSHQENPNEFSLILKHIINDLLS